MPTRVETLSRNILARLDELGKTKRGASLAATGKEDAIREIERGKMPAADRLRALADELATTPEALMSDEPLAKAPRIEEVRVADTVLPFNNAHPAMNLPIYGTALGHTLHFDDNGEALVEQTIIEQTEAIRYIQRPAALAQVKTAYAVYIQGDSMSPRYDPGELAVVDPRKPPSPGDDVIVQILGEEELVNDGASVKTVLIKRLVRRSASYVELRQFNPPITFKVASDRIVSVHRIVPIGDLLGA